ncbi:MAG: GNAT family N-acetyltransferase [Desulfurococcales archaeon]|nr:GNAT family N-acetyltransferase [Desulfurococcales archaeon]
MGVRVRHAVREDIDVMAEVFAKAFRVGMSEAREVFEVSMDVQPDGCFVAVTDTNSIAGTGCFFIYGPLAWIGNVAVLPQLQRRGIGTSLMKELLREMGCRGVRTVRLDASRYGHGLYLKLGFIDEYRTVTYRITAPPTSGSGDALQVTGEVPEWVFRIDAEAFGADRSMALKALLRRGAALITLGRRGYAIVRGEDVGPVVAEGRDAAEALIAKAYELGARKLIVIERNPEAVGMAKELRWVPEDVCVRMRLGPPCREKVNLIYAALSYAKG